MSTDVQSSEDMFTEATGLRSSKESTSTETSAAVKFGHLASTDHK
jgi:hypothetical protein